jgi:hypothetical protein
MKPILKIKRGNNSIPSGLASGELAVDLGKKRLYVGNDTGVSIPIACEVSTEASLGGSIAASSDDKIVTEKAIKTFYQQGGVAEINTKEVLSASIGEYQISSSLAPDYQYIPLDTEGTVVLQTPNMNLQYFDDTSPFYSGFFQTYKNEIILQANYSVYVTAIQNFTEGEGSATPGYWRSFGFRVINTRVATGNPSSDVQYYGMQVLNPAIGNSSSPAPTLINGSSIIRLPKSILTGTSASVWELQFVFRTNTFFNTLYAGWVPGAGPNDPPISENYSMRLEFTKLHESTV